MATSDLDIAGREIAAVLTPGQRAAVCDVLEPDPLELFSRCAAAASGSPSGGCRPRREIRP